MSTDRLPLYELRLYADFNRRGLRSLKHDASAAERVELEPVAHLHRTHFLALVGWRLEQNFTQWHLFLGCSVNRSSIDCHWTLCRELRATDPPVSYYKVSRRPKARYPENFAQ